MANGPCQSDVTRHRSQMPEVFIGRVPPGTTVAQLEEHFVPYGGCNIRAPAGKGCAFATFESWAQAEKAIEALSGLKLTDGPGDGLNVKLADAKGAVKGVVQKPRVFIGGVHPACTDEAIQLLCEQFGQVTQTKIFAKSPDSMPCAFVTFNTFTEAENCILGLSGISHQLAADGKTFNVRFADVPKNTPADTGIGKIANTAPRIEGPAIAPGLPIPDHVRASTTATERASSKVFIGGLHEAVTEEFVRGMMAPFGEVVEAKIHRKPGVPPCGFIRLAEQADANRAVAIIGSLGRIVVKFADDNRPSKRTFQAAFP